MARTKKREFTLKGAQLLMSGDVIRIGDPESPLKCRVLSCLGTDDGGCLASLEVLEGERKGERINTKLVPAGGSDAEDTHA
ncbi:MAG: hypothetical protein RDU20_18000 [Desulfomonilaceae bacterium]|nr:hypothetical protein [Desulfomonilaceae bacterium]